VQALQPELVAQMHQRQALAQETRQTVLMRRLQALVLQEQQEQVPKQQALTSSGQEPVLQAQALQEQERQAQRQSADWPSACSFCQPLHVLPELPPSLQHAGP
jgi:hypothetical protein